MSQADQIGDVSVIQDILKEQLEPDIKDQIKWQDPLLEDGITLAENVKPLIKKIENNKYEISSLISGMTAYGMGESDDPIASGIGLNKMYVVPYFARAQYIVNDVSITETLSSVAALTKNTELYGLEIRRAMLRKKGRDLRGDGSGIVGVLDVGEQTSNIINISRKARGTVDSHNIYGLGALRVFQEGAKIELGTETMFENGTTVKATIVGIPNDGQIKLDAAYTVGTNTSTNNRKGTNANTWHIRFKGEYKKTAMGLLGLVDDGTFAPQITEIQGLVRADFPFMRSVVSNPDTSANILTDFEELYDDVTMFNSEVKYWAVSTDVYADYSQALTQTMQVFANQSTAAYTSKLGKGHSGLMFAYGGPAFPILKDRYLPAGTALLLDPEQYFLAQLTEDKFLDGAIMAHISRTVLYETIRVSYYNFGTFGSRMLGGRIQYKA